MSGTTSEPLDSLLTTSLHIAAERISELVKKKRKKVDHIHLIKMYYLKYYN